MLRKTLFILTALFTCSSWAAIDALQFADAQQEKDYHQLTQELRCPQCQNNNIADSNATIAVDMRGKVFELLQEGKSKQDVVDYMVARYGNFVTYNPPLTAATLLLWIMPAFLVGLGLFIVLRRKKTQVKSAVEITEVLTDEQQQRLQAILQEKE
ncbi:MAG: cytochrome c-type biogenesis protein CcmH [Lonepinella koalarum]|nr:cytochrome c-type biogenesis protein CcmH [Lonepinella koalarum]